MDDVRTKSGPWRGWWIQAGHRGTMKVTLRFHGDEIFGRGTDDTGSFQMKGTVGLGGAMVTIEKKYSMWTVYYEGRWDGRQITGAWYIPPGTPFTRGVFELWPEEGETSIEEFFAQKSEEKAKSDEKELVTR